MIEVYKVIFFPNGNTGCFDKSGQQIPSLQKSWIQLYFEFLESKEIKPEGIIFVCPTLNEAKPFKTSEGNWNWEFK